MKFKATAWQNIKGMLSDQLLMWAMELLPVGSIDRREVAEFLHGYMIRSSNRTKGDGNR